MDFNRADAASPHAEERFGKHGVGFEYMQYLG
jgi:hypothetical protein